MKTKQDNFIRPTLYFSIAGLFIPGFTAFFLFGVQILLTKIGFECPNSWTIIWTISIAGALTWPIVFFKLANQLTHQSHQKFLLRLTFFNLFEYVLIQSSLTPLFTNRQVLCYGSGGQNGLELAFTAWLSLPILILLSLFFDIEITKKH